MKAEENVDAKPKPRITIPPGALVILPLRNMVLFPSTIMPLVVGRPTSLQVVEEAVRQQSTVGFIAQRDPQIEVPRPKDLFEVGTAADILRMFALPDGQRQIIIQGRQRFEVAFAAGAYERTESDNRKNRQPVVVDRYHRLDTRFALGGEARDPSDS
jgi:ATP-dependent Lon protease